MERKVVFREVQNMIKIGGKTTPDFILLYERALLLALLEQGDINEVQFQLCMDQLGTYEERERSFPIP